MRFKIIRDLGLLITGFGIIWLAFLLFPFNCNQKLEISLEDERKFGDLLANRLILDYNEDIRHREARLDSAVSIITARLLNGGKTGLFDYKFYILEDSTVNAFTIPGGHIFLHRGLFMFCNSAEELAGVISHEIGHCEHRHSMRKLLKEVGLSVVISTMSGGNSGQLTEYGQLVVSSKFSRDYEKDADKYAVRLMENSGINPVVLSDFFERLNEAGLHYPESMEWMASHPHNNSRIENIKEHRLPAHFRERKLPIDWTQVKSED